MVKVKDTYNKEKSLIQKNISKLKKSEIIYFAYRLLYEKFHRAMFHEQEHKGYLEKTSSMEKWMNNQIRDFKKDLKNKKNIKKIIKIK